MTVVTNARSGVRRIQYLLQALRQTGLVSKPATFYFDNWQLSFRVWPECHRGQWDLCHAFSLTIGTINHAPGARGAVML